MTKTPDRRFIPEFDRRQTLKLLGGTAITATAGISASGSLAESHAADQSDIIRSHGYSFFGDLQYPADYAHFDYVNPSAPKGGEISISARGTFDNMNRYAWKGGRSGMFSGLTAESMFGDGPFGAPTPSDSITDSYGLIAEAVEYPKSKEWCVFHMRPEARFSDGSPLTAHDAAFSHDLFATQAIRSYQAAVKERVKGYEVIDDHTIRFSFNDDVSRRSLVSLVGGTSIFSKAWYEKTGERLDESSQLIQLGSGPYLLEDFEINRYIVYRRNPDYWGWHLPINVGRHNFDRVRVEYFADDTAEFEGFKAGLYTFRQEGSTKKWATAYDFDAVADEHIKREELPNGNPPTPSGFVFNMLREPFSDIRVREALQLAFNFEWTSSSLQYDLTKQRHSFVEGTDIEAKGVPEGLEKAFLESLGDLVPPELYSEDAVKAHTSKPERTVDRRNKRKSLKLLAEAGWTVGDDGKVRNSDGDAMEFKVMLSSATSDTAEAIITTYVGNLEDIGITASMEKVDSAQYAQRYYDKDWDMMYFRNQTFLAAGGGLKQSYGSESAVVSSYNPQSLQSPLVDAIIEKSLYTESREEEVASLMALDRTLRHLRIQIPVGFVSDYWVAYYDMFERPEVLPPLAMGYLDFWWFNEEKHAALKAAGALR